MGSLRPVATLFASAACTGLLQTPGARAHDSLAAPGALHTWLPKEGWVKRHWLPFDERQLTTRLDIRDRELEGYLYDDHRPLADLAIARDDSPGSCFSAPLTKLDAIYFTLGTCPRRGPVTSRRCPSNAGRSSARSSSQGSSLS